MSRSQDIWRRPVELVLGLGIPLVGFFTATRTAVRLPALWVLLPAMLLAGWHILRVNDLCFDRGAVTGKRLRRPHNFVPLFVAPLVAAALLLLRGRSDLAALVLIMLNWDLYAWWGKRFWPSGLLHNFLGGGLHFLLGVTVAVGYAKLPVFLPQTLFFALTMAGASFHHDALHEAEDGQLGYRTGAVVFGANRWWRLGILPLLLAQASLCFATRDFVWPFAAAFGAYFVLYAVFSCRRNPGREPVFRALCRLAYAAAGIAYLAVRMKTMS